MHQFKKCQNEKHEVNEKKKRYRNLAHARGPPIS